MQKSEMFTTKMRQWGGQNDMLKCWKWKAIYYRCLVHKNNSRFAIWDKGSREQYNLGKLMFRRGEGSECLCGGIWVLACITLWGATGAHTSELHFLQAHHAIHRGDRNTCIQTYTHIHMLASIHGHTYTDMHTHANTLTVHTHVFPAAISTALQPN